MGMQQWEKVSIHWCCTQRLAVGIVCMTAASRALFNRDENGRIIGGAGCCEACWMDGRRDPLPEQARRGIVATLPPPKAAMTKGDRVGSCSRDHRPDSEAGCRLGCACTIHKAARPAPYVPSIDDWDLLPDAGR